ncbi:endothelin-converting enzyme [Lophiostoma macrostomum CBS 122681]|uniref:Endothelin-converting enzyme n=1 Tax=Lophiostoma macrostomum CBS 122681 TaxID=1314788 RepID=A0A6A6TM65_9PLEO|nr:endothelin-converting enzyme [Lophiostoma macrostomum CBS 122681]
MFAQASRSSEATEKSALLHNSSTEHLHQRRVQPYSTRSLVTWLVAFSLSFALALVFILPDAQGIPYHEPTRKYHEPKTCLTPACIHASSEILYNLSPDREDIDACTDFEELVCGGWKDRHDLRPDQGHTFTGIIMSENSQTLLRHILEAPYPKDSEHSYFSPMQLSTSAKSEDEQNFDKMKAVYEACLDEDVIKKAGTAPLLGVLDDIVKLFPISSREEMVTADDTSSIKDTVLYLSKLGIAALLSMGTGPDDTDPDSVIVSVSAPYRIGLPAKERYQDFKILRQYEDVIAQVLPALLPDQGIENSTISDLVIFEAKLARSSPDAEDRDDVTQYYNPQSLEEAGQLTPQLGLPNIIKSLASSDVSIDRVIVMTPQYQKDLAENLLTTSKETLQTYFIWKAVQALSSYVESDVIAPYSRFSNILAGKDPDSTPERWRTCVGHVDNGVGWILSRFFVEKAFSAKAKEFGDRMVSDIKALFTEKLKKTDWMEKSVVELAISKVHNIVQKIGYPTKSPDIMDPTKLQKYYKLVDVDAKEYFGNALSMRRFQVAEEWSALGKPVDREQWDMTVPTVNAYYNPPGNEIVFPAGIMQFPVFSVDLPEYVSYGAFASVAGHELSHAFDSTGRHYDQNGNYTDWWTNATVKAFKERAECFVEQYSNYSIDIPNGSPLHVNGRLTLGENIADAGGVAAGFAAWKRRADKKPNEDLPGLGNVFTHEQMFFVSYANWWCSKTRTETARDRIYTDPHAPEWARILGTMANSRDFRREFKCKQKEPVCELW